jgi:hypothetical protein
VAQLSTAEKGQAALLLGMRGPGGGLTGNAQEVLDQAIINRNAEGWLKPGAPMSSRDEFARFVKSPEMKKLFKEKTGREYTGTTDLDKMTHAQVQQLVELAMPETANLRCAYDQVNNAVTQTVSSQLAALLKDGKLPLSEYTSEGITIPR